MLVITITNVKLKRLITITEGWYTITEEEDGLYFNDLRFGLMSMQENETKFAFTYKIDQGANELKVTETPKMPSDAKGLFSALWARIWGN